jgi:hypothetical protein
LCGDSRPERISCSLKDKEETLPLVLPEVPARRLDRVLQQSPVVREDPFRARVANVLDEAGGSFDVREEKSNSAGWEVGQDNPLLLPEKSFYDE